MPQQVPRLAAVFVVAIAALLLARSVLIPETFGDLGHYRAAAVDSIAARPVKHAGARTCAGCHGPIDTKRLAGNHRGVSCEGCHGASQIEIGPGAGDFFSLEFG